MNQSALIFHLTNNEGDRDNVTNSRGSLEWLYKQLVQLELATHLISERFRERSMEHYELEAGLKRDAAALENND